MNKSESINELAAALVLAQPLVETAKLNSKNPAFSGSRYADLGAVWEAVQGALIANGLAITQFPSETVTGHPALLTMLVHKSGQWISATYPLVCVKQDPQGYGSALTYAKRYGIAAVMGVVADDDDDGNLASSKPKAAPNKPNVTMTAGPQQANNTVQTAATGSPSNGKMTPAEEWASAELVIIRAAPTPAVLKAWETQNDAKLKKLKQVDPGLYDAIIAAINSRAKELLA